MKKASVLPDMNKEYIMKKLMLSLFVLAGCWNGLESPPTGGTTEGELANGTLLVRLVLPVSAGLTSEGTRTLYPTILADLSYELQFTSATASHATEPMHLNQVNIVELRSGTWEIQARGLNSGLVPVSVGSATVSIVANESSSLTITMGPASEGHDGYLHYSVTLPSAVTARIYICDMTGNPVNMLNNPQLLSSSGAKNEGTLPLPPGIYMLQLEADQDYGDYINLIEVLHIYPFDTTYFIIADP